MKLNFDVENIPAYCAEFDFHLIPLEPLDALNSLKLPPKENHKDPFDRMLIYQSIKYNYTLVSRDDKMKFYESDGLKCVW
jgi:PIN domain nuclease of toxin-antitoxin system